MSRAPQATLYRAAIRYANTSDGGTLTTRLMFAARINIAETFVNLQFYIILIVCCDVAIYVILTDTKSNLVSLYRHTIVVLHFPRAFWQNSEF